MFDPDTIDDLTEEPPRAPVLGLSSRHQFELGLTLPLLDGPSALSLLDRHIKNDQAPPVLISINHATRICHAIDKVMTSRFQQITSTF